MLDFGAKVYLWVGGFQVICLRECLPLDLSCV